MSEFIKDIFSETLIITFIVIMMMMVIEFIHIKTKGKLVSLMDKNPTHQIILSTLLGLTPGCAGVFAVVALYTHNIIGFGALLAACIASFGDEAFFMLSLIPSKAVLIGSILFCLGIICGLLYNYLKPFQSTNDTHQMEHFVIHDEHEQKRSKPCSKNRFTLISLIVLFVIGIYTGIIGEHEKGGHGLGGEKVMFVIISACTLFMLCFSNRHFIDEHIWDHIIKKHFLKILLWTFGVLTLLHFLMFYIDLNSLNEKNTGKVIMLLIALSIGLIPQSGPHLAVVYLFIDGIIPFSTLLANSILQEGHGGIPLIAESTKDFLKLKAVKFIIAILVGIAGIMTGW